MNTVSTHPPGGARPVRRELPRLPTLADLVAANRAVTRYADAQARARTLPELPRPHALVAGTAQKWRSAALGQRRQLLSIRDASAAATAVDSAVFGPQHPDVTAMLVAQLLDCFPADKLGNPQAFFEALVFDLGDAGFSDATIAVACMELRRTSKFRPSIAEVLDRCRAKHLFAQAVTAGHQRYADRLEAVHLVLHHTGGDPDQAEVTAHAQHLDDPLLLAEYAKGSTNDWLFDVELNPALRQPADEPDEVWQARFRRMKADVEADPQGALLVIERARGARAGRELARECHRGTGLDRRRQGCDRIKRMSLSRFPDGQPADLWEAWENGAVAAFFQTFDELEPNYDADERGRHERDARERAERAAVLRRHPAARAAEGRRR